MLGSVIDSPTDPVIRIGAPLIRITGLRKSFAGIEAIQAGDLYGTATEDPGTIGAATAEYTLSFLNGDEPERVVTMEEHRVTSDNVAEFAEQCSVA